MPSSPLVILRTVADRQVIVCLCDNAFARGIRRGMTLTQARALCADVEHAEHDPARDRRALEALGRWLMRFTPTVALDSSQSGDGIFLDITGCERLFGSVQNIVRQVSDALAWLAISASVAVAPTPGAAWALAAFGNTRPQKALHPGPLPGVSAFGSEDPFGSESQGRRGQRDQSEPHAIAPIASPDTLLQMLAPLPPTALRISDDLAGVLHHLGLVRIGQVIDLPRGLLPARFGPELLLRIDQALGRITEPLVPLEYLPPITARMDFDGGVFSLEAIWAIFQQLIGQIITQLTHRGCGARRLDIELLHFHEPPLRKSILLSRPSRDAVNLFNLFRCGMEEEGTEARRHEGTKGKDQGAGTEARRHGGTEGKNEEERAGLPASLSPRPNPSYLRAAVYPPRRVPSCLSPSPCLSLSLSSSDSGYSGMILRVPIFEPLTDRQIGLLGQQEYDSQAELDRLLERLRLRLGEQSVASARLAEAYIPEKAWETRGEGTKARRDEEDRHEGTKARRHEGLGRGERDAGIVLAFSALPLPFVPSCLRASVPSSCLSSPSPSSLSPLRPLHLFPQPMEIRVMVSPSDEAEGQPAAFTHNGQVRTIVHVVGPERIAGRWWDGHDKTRDYFDVEDTTARRHWLFRVRETGKWYLHGRFE